MSSSMSKSTHLSLYYSTLYITPPPPPCPYHLTTPHPVGHPYVSFSPPTHPPPLLSPEVCQMACPCIYCSTEVDRTIVHAVGGWVDAGSAAEKERERQQERESAREKEADTIFSYSNPLVLFLCLNA